jgi:hypothetical protein
VIMAPPLQEPITIVIPGEAVAFARTGQHGAMHFTPPKQRGHEALIRSRVGHARQRALVLSGFARRDGGIPRAEKSVEVGASGAVLEDLQAGPGQFGEARR